MKQFTICVLVFLFSSNVMARTHVHSYHKRDGTFVHSHNRTDANRTERDNWSSKPNVNPETGKAGTKEPKK
jgi:hypothetical protein